jgi:hypothetical protein
MGTFYLMLQAEKSINFLAFASSFFDLALLSILRRTNVMTGTLTVSSLCTIDQCSDQLLTDQCPSM